MKTYTVVPNKDVTGWLVKMEDVAPTDVHEDRDSAVQVAKELAEKNKPSKLTIMNGKHEVEEEMTF
ncbi:DUF2188 domain-containing protein [Thalassobacillus hwangdonensis]|uniref:DUF2188 domain-containing protein n=1 Tax=Thalassobacillus hwangdonensis TaxID=546108 RepID=A0ABW3L1V0_9BACI